MTWNLGLEYCISYRSVPAIHQLDKFLNVKHLTPLMETVSVCIKFQKFLDGNVNLLLIWVSNDH